MKDTYISDSVLYVGVDDKDIDLFEGQYVVPNGISYNSYIIMDDKIAVLDTADARVTEEWVKNIKAALGDKTLDYLIISHMEPDHAANVRTLLDIYPDICLVGNAKTFTMLSQFYRAGLTDNRLVVKEGDTLCLGSHTLTFVMAPMVHWPEVMMSYESSEKILFAADAFGKFGTLDTEEDWACEARRYYFNIVGKYGVQVQALLKKASGLDIKTICPLHGPILKENLEYYTGKYDIWSRYEPEDKGIFIAYASIHGNTAAAAKQFAEMLKAKGAPKVSMADLTRDDMAEAVEDAFRYDRLVLAASSYNAGLFPPMEEFLHHLAGRNYQNRTVGIIENGSWALSAGKCMKAILDGMKNITLLEPTVSIVSTPDEKCMNDMEALADSLLK